MNMLRREQFKRLLKVCRWPNDLGANIQENLDHIVSEQRFIFGDENLDPIQRIFGPTHFHRAVALGRSYSPAVLIWQAGVAQGIEAA